MHPSIFTKLFDDRSLEERITIAAEIGFDGVEIMSREPRLAHVHVEDLSRIDNLSLSDAFSLETPRGEAIFRRETLSEGDVDHAPLFEALAESGYDGHLTLETNVR